MRALAVFGVVLLSACGGGGGERAEERAEERVEAGTETARARDACEVLSEAEVAALAGEAVTARPGRRSGPTRSSCGWFGSSTETPYLELTLHWSEGRAAWEAQRSGYAMARDMIGSAEQVGIDSIVKPGPVAGLGDSAIFADLMPAVVLEGDRMVQLTMFHLPEARTKFRPLAAKVLERMKNPGG